MGGDQRRPIFKAMLVGWGHRFFLLHHSDRVDLTVAIEGNGLARQFVRLPQRFDLRILGGGRRAIENSSYADDKKKVKGGDRDQGYDKKKLHDDDAFLYLPSS